MGGWRRAVGGFVVAMVMMVAAIGPAVAAKPKSGTWFTDAIDATDESNASSVQFKVAKSGKKLTKLTIFWRCGDSREYHQFSNSPFPFGVDKKKRFKIVGATEAPAGESSRDFKLQGKFKSKKTARYSMKLTRCGGKTKGLMRHVG